MCATGCMLRFVIGDKPPHVRIAGEPIGRAGRGPTAYCGSSLLPGNEAVWRCLCERVE